jgi:hypothetical protein
MHYWYKDDDILTLVTKKIDFPEINNTLLVEYVPGVIASAEELMLLQEDTQLLIDKPFLLFNTTQSVLNYAIRKGVDSSELKKATTLLIRLPSRKLTAPKATLFGIYNPNNIPIKPNKYVLILAGVIISAIILVKDLRPLKKAKSGAEITLGSTKALMMQGNLAEAAGKYCEFQKLYACLGQQQQQRLANQARELAYELNFRYAADKITKALKTEDKNSRNAVLNEVQTISASLPNNYRQKLQQQLSGLRAS